MRVEVAVGLAWPWVLRRDYVPGQKLRIEVYRRLARLRNVRKLDDFRQELRDRFGPPPPETEWLLKLAELRMLAARWQIASIHRKDQDLIMKYRNDRQAQRLAERSGGPLKVVDESHLYYRIGSAEEEPETPSKLSAFAFARRNGIRASGSISVNGDFAGSRYACHRFAGLVCYGFLLHCCSG
jgi:transcription-repair coupling factor (superfamily II helicase)